VATTVLTVVGTAIGGPIGGAVGAGIGGIIDQELFFQQESPTGKEPTLDDIRISTASEGQGVPFFVGQKHRVAGTVVWMSPNLIEREVTEEVGGKGGDDEETIVLAYEYFVHMAVVWGTNADGQVALIDRIWANGNLWYRHRPVDFSLDAFSGEMEVDGLLAQIGVLKSEDSGSDLTTVTLGAPVTIGGFTDANNNGTFNATAKWTDENGDTFLELSREVGSFSDETVATDTITLTQSKPETRPGSADSITFCDGKRETQDWATFQQDADGGAPANALLVSEAASQDRFRELAYTVFEAFAITPYGNQVPQLSARVVNSSSDVPLSDVVKQIWRLTGRPDTDLDFTLHDDSVGILKDNVFGWSIVGPTSPKEALTSILITTGMRVREIAGKLHFIDRGSEETVTIETADLGFHVPGQDSPLRS